MAWVRGSRLPLWFLEFRQGSAPETILQDFPAIASLENVYGTITDYLANPPKVEEYLKAQNRSGKNSGNRPIHCQQALPHASKAFAGNRRIWHPLLDDPIEDRLDLCRESCSITSQRAVPHFMRADVDVGIDGEILRFERIRVHHQGHSVLVRRLTHFRDQRWSDHRQSALRTDPPPTYVFTQIPPDALTAATVAAGVCVASSAPWERWMGVRDRSFA